MKKPFYLLLFISTLYLFADASFNGRVKDTAGAVPVIDTLAELSQTSTIKNYIGHLSFREKLRLYRYIKKEGRHRDDTDKLTKHANSDAKLGFIFALAGILFAYALVPGFILSNRALRLEKQHPGILTERNLAHAKAGKNISITGAVILVIAAILFVIILSSVSFSCRIR